ncbi:MAG: hypothetical protein MUR36_05790, partial [Paracoccaceae bacterium]|nr:hypothetical protein [Paracoccaceae bacterium]
GNWAVRSGASLPLCFAIFNLSALRVWPQTMAELSRLCLILSTNPGLSALICRTGPYSAIAEK